VSSGVEHHPVAACEALLDLLEPSLDVEGDPAGADVECVGLALPLRGGVLPKDPHTEPAQHANRNQRGRRQPPEDPARVGPDHGCGYSMDSTALAASWACHKTMTEAQTKMRFGLLLGAAAACVKPLGDLWLAAWQTIVLPLARRAWAGRA
jgi:hypothetical protein